MEKTYRDYACFDECYEDFRELCKEGFRDAVKVNLYVHLYKTKIQGSYCICNKSRRHLLKVFQIQTLFKTSFKKG